jgi:hypothetical protein
MSYQSTIAAAKGDPAAATHSNRATAIVQQAVPDAPAAVVTKFLNSFFGDKIASEELNGKPVHVQLAERPRRFRKHFDEIWRIYLKEQQQ